MLKFLTKSNICIGIIMIIKKYICQNIFDWVRNESHRNEKPCQLKLAGG